MESFDEGAGELAEDPPSSLGLTDAAQDGQLALGELVGEVFGQVVGWRCDDHRAVAVRSRGQKLTRLADGLVGERAGENVDAVEREDELAAGRKAIEGREDFAPRRGPLRTSSQAASEARDVDRCLLHPIH